MAEVWLVTISGSCFSSLDSYLYELVYYTANMTVEITPPASGTQLSYRIASRQDLPLLIQLREECGWGADKIAAFLDDPDRVYCIFQLPVDGHLQDVGMACWVLENKSDPETASRAHQSVFLGMSRASNITPPRPRPTRSIPVHPTAVPEARPRRPSHGHSRTSRRRAVWSQVGHAGHCGFPRSIFRGRGVLGGMDGQAEPDGRVVSEARILAIQGES